MPRLALAIAQRVITQLRRDHRTLGLIIVVPVVVMTLIGYSMPNRNAQLELTAPALIAMMALFFSFLLTGISFLRERSQGTMERLMVSPVSRTDIVLGYLLGFMIFALIQTLIIFFFTVWIFDVPYKGALWEILVFQMAIVIGSVTLGIFISTFAKNEFQMVQFIPLIIVPQVFLGGVLWPVEQMNGFLQGVSKILPLTYAVDGLRNIMRQGESLGGVGGDLAFLLGFAVFTSILAALTLRRRAGG
ncbi:ABC transporter permease [Dehalogenimonas etheniformans]|uniref:Transport permease protein n=1 Tax=Dehalogenimonas etheniformans TaxID=1536648 RepID=A0A2P5P985_9CHLR|nr:ABC transporter permease [Dehalogenimonas etheniformans]PPD58844.1 ABC transporter permease [Dehalogenimonas etheniformans]QNT76386.1 ABC transporter permease [Dehalogenimonas etheniformans]